MVFREQRSLLLLKECEFRYNHKNDMMKVLEEIMRS